MRRLTSLLAPVGRKAIEEGVEYVYDHPLVDADSVPGIVSLDLGAVPGEVKEGIRRTLRLGDSEMIDTFDWASEEAGRQLAKYAKAHPAAKEIRIEVRAPMGVKRHDLYRYLREKNVVVHEDIGRDSASESQYVSKPIPGGLETMSAGKLTLSDDDGKACYPSRNPEGGGSCLIADTYGIEMKRRAKAAR